MKDQTRPAEPTGVDFEVPDGRGFIALLEAFRATGGTAPDEIVARLLEEHQAGNAASLARLVRTGQVFCFEWCGSHWVPIFQFNPCDLALNAGVQQVRTLLPPRWTGWTLASWFAVPNARLDGHCPVDMLDADLAAVVRAARSRGPTDGLPRPHPYPRVQRVPEAAVR